MTAPRVTSDGAWTGFQGVNGDKAAANASATDPVTILDAVEVPIVVVRGDFRVACFNKGLSSPSGGEADVAVPRNCLVRAGFVAG